MVFRYFCVALLLAPGICYAGGKDIVASKVWPQIRLVSVRARVVFERSQYLYAYEIQNPKVNDVSFDCFMIDIRVNPEEHPFAITDVNAVHSEYEHSNVIVAAQSVVPISIVSPVSRFSATLLRPTWCSSNPIANDWINPGETLTGFGIMAGEPPGIREFNINGITQEFLDTPEMYIHPTAKTHAELIEEVNKGINYYSKTIAPVKPPEAFTVSSWVARMNADTSEARKLKWIKTDVVLREIKKLVAELNAANTEKLKVSVKKISDYVQTEKVKGNLTDEADALVRLNAEYLLRRLTAPVAVKPEK